MKLQSEDVAYIEEALNTMMLARQDIPKVMSDAQKRIAHILRYVATVAGREACDGMLDALLQQFDDHLDYFDVMNDGFKMRVDLAKGIAKL